MGGGRVTGLDDSCIVGVQADINRVMFCLMSGIVRHGLLIVHVLKHL